MRIRLVVDKTGRRHDGQDWPHRGGEIDVGDEEGAALCAQGDAIPVVSDGVEVPEQPDPAVETRGGDTGTAAETLAVAEEPAAGKPIVNAPKAAWVDFAVTRGFDRAVAGSMTKADLIARFGRDQGAPEG